MRRGACGCALVALMVSWCAYDVAAAEHFGIFADSGGANVEGLIALDKDRFLSYAAQTESAITAYDDCCQFYDAPNWTIWAGAIFLQRESPDGQTLVSSGGTSLLGASDLNFATQGGPDLNAILHGEVFDVGFRYFHVNQMAARQRIFPPGGVAIIETGVPFPINTPTLDALYVTSIQSVEVNLRRNVSPRLSLLAGFRYVSLRDDLGHIFSIAGLAARLNANGINRLYGGQIGADAMVWTAGRFQLQSALKAGVYGNGANNALRLNGTGIPETSISRSAQQVAFLGDWNFAGVVQITDIWAFRAGYQLLWLSGLALASEQYPVLPGDFLPTADVITNGDLFLHGALVSIQAGW